MPEPLPAAEFAAGLPPAPPLPWMQRALRLGCPHCGLCAMPAGRKLLSDWNPTHCQACGQAVAIDAWYATLVLTPLVGGCVLLAALAWFVRMPPAWMASFLALAIPAALTGYATLVPLRRTRRTDWHAVARARRAAQASPPQG